MGASGLALFAMVVVCRKGGVARVTILPRLVVISQRGRSAGSLSRESGDLGQRLVMQQLTPLSSELVGVGVHSDKGEEV